MFTLGAMVFFLGAHWLASGMCCYAPAGLTGFHMGVEYEVAFQLGMTPPFMFAMAPIGNDETWFTNNEYPSYVAVAFAGDTNYITSSGSGTLTVS